MKKVINLIISGMSFIFLIFLIGCNNSEIKESEKNPLNNGETIEAGIDEFDFPYSDSKINVWMAYWSTDDFDEEVDHWNERIDDIVYFASYFDENNKLFIPDSIAETKEIIDEVYENKSMGNYISFVNDKANGDGTSNLKDTDLLYSLFESEESMDNHIVDIINIAISGGYEGIEIDYEKIRNDLKLWEKFSIFLDKLIKSAEENNLSLRVLLEPATPVEKISLPEGPQYIMMCYNLYGYGTEAGPKANKEFLLQLVDKMKKISENRGYALATGGFDFSENGDIKAITRVEAEGLLVEYNTDEGNIKPARDKDSYSMIFEYTDENEVKHEVWYADDITLKYWETILRDSGEENISIWKLGGTIGNY